jgi:hypothetical protein
VFKSGQAINIIADNELQQFGKDEQAAEGFQRGPFQDCPIVICGDKMGDTCLTLADVCF